MDASCAACLAFFDKNYVYEVTGKFSIEEKAESGKGLALFESTDTCLVIKSKKQSPLLWSLAQRKCADGAFITFDSAGNASLHIVELKSKITLDTWAHALHQFEGMLFAALAVARLLQIASIDTVKCYIVGTQEVMGGSSASLALLKTPVGSGRTLGGKEAWDKGIVELPYGIRADLTKAWKDARKEADLGVVA